MSWFSLTGPLGTNYRVEPNDIVNTKRALAALGYYSVPPERGIDDWTDSPMFDGIRRFQKANGLKVDGFMRPGGPTERAINQQVAGGGGYRAIDPSSLFRHFDRFASDVYAKKKDGRCRATGTCDDDDDEEEDIVM